MREVATLIIIVLSCGFLIYIATGRKRHTPAGKYARLVAELFKIVPLAKILVRDGVVLIVKLLLIVQKVGMVDGPAVHIPVD